MSTVMVLDEIATVARCRRSKATPARLTTTLYDLIIAIQEGSESRGRRAGGSHRGAPPAVQAG